MDPDQTAWMHAGCKHCWFCHDTAQMSYRMANPEDGLVVKVCHRGRKNVTGTLTQDTKNTVLHLYQFSYAATYKLNFSLINEQFYTFILALHPNFVGLSPSMGHVEPQLCFLKWHQFWLDQGNLNKFLALIIMMQMENPFFNKIDRYISYGILSKITKLIQ
jgi:hypothetical protein